MLNDIKDKIFSKGFSTLLLDCFYDVGGSDRKEIPFYYNFLFRFIQCTLSRKVIEVGTYQGGSSLAMAQALKIMSPVGSLVTIDITDQVTNKDPFITFIIGDSENSDVLDLSIIEPPIDILYIDSVHSYESVKSNILSYSKFKPKFIILDDILLNSSMKKAWATLSKNHEAIDVSKEVHRPCGFGVIKCR